MSGDYSRFTFKPGKRFSGVLMQQGRVQLDADWNEEIAILKRRWEIQATDTFGYAAVPKKTTPNGFKVLTPNPLTIEKGRMYVDGLLAERFDKDPHHSDLFLSSPIPVLTAGQEAIVYLDVWEREVTYIEDPDILEPALGGPDTATRLQVVWQVKVRATASPRCGLDLNALFPPSAGRLTSKAVAPPASDDPCVLPPTGNYRGLENRLYRVEVHTGGTLGTATYKWSRENASIASRVTKISGKTITVNRIGRDKVLRFQPGDWVEITDDILELQGARGHMAKVVVPDEANQTLELDRALPAVFDATDLKRHTRVRRWDQRKDEKGDPLADGGSGTLKTGGGPVTLEDGVQIEITADPATGTLKTGDYWVFTARAVDGSVEELKKAPPHGIHHHYAQLASWDGYQLHDCRRLWPDDCCCCTVEVGDGINSHGDFNNIAKAYAAAKDQVRDEGVPIRICLLPGVHRPKETVVIERSLVTISGCGLASRVVAPRDQSIFEMFGTSTDLENVYLLSEPEDTQRPALVVLYSYGSRIENNLFESIGGPLLLCQSGRSRILRNTFVGNRAIQAGGWDLVIAWNELSGAGGGEERGALIDLRPDLYGAFIIENRLENGSGHGIALSPPVTNPELGYGLYLSDLVIAGNDIRYMRGSGIATLLFLDKGSAASGISGDPYPGGPPPGTTPVNVYRLRIENNTIAYCALPGTWERDDGAPQGGIVLGGIEHLEIADNQIEFNGAYTSESPVAGIYLGTVRGLIVRDNIVTGNGLQTVGKAVETNEGGIVARDLSEALEVASTSLSPDARSINRPNYFQRPDGWPAAMVHGNLVVAPRGRALVLLGLGAMHVTDNRLLARELVARADPEGIGLVGAVLIRSGNPYFQYISLRWTTPVFIGEGSVTFSDNEVFLDDIAPPGSLETMVVTITAGQDLAFQDNLIRCWKGMTNLELKHQFNTVLWSTNVRASGNGIHEEPFYGFFWSLYVFANILSAVTGNQVTHCLYAPGPDQQHALANNAEQFCNRGTFDRYPVAARSETANRAMFERMAFSARAEAAALRTQPPQPAAPQLSRARPVEAFEAKALAAESLAERLEYGLRLADRTKEIKPSDWSLLGRVLDPEGKPVAGARLEISEGTKKLSEIPADDNGEFFAHYSGERFKDLFARAPQLKLTIKSADGKVLQTLERPLVPKGDQLEALELRIGEPSAPPLSGGTPAPQAPAAEPEPPGKPQARSKKESSKKPGGTKPKGRPQTGKK
ncbi:MAG: hypothetical protein QOH06_2186 [Acidobacteriota bacterium]|jgi:hypothetical protein|nr:hypothetical protein [Acidobacteriota bacterium]